jgi:hypothetical protein
LFLFLVSVLLVVAGLPAVRDDVPLAIVGRLGDESAGCFVEVDPV